MTAPPALSLVRQRLRLARDAQLEEHSRGLILLLNKVLLLELVDSALLV
jgi:hypothetical protein